MRRELGSCHRRPGPGAAALPWRRWRARAPAGAPSGAGPGACPLGAGARAPSPGQAPLPGAGGGASGGPRPGLGRGAAGGPPRVGFPEGAVGRRWPTPGSGRRLLPFSGFSLLFQCLRKWGDRGAWCARARVSVCVSVCKSGGVWLGAIFFS